MVDVIIPESGYKKGRYLKILAELNLDKPLLRGTKTHCQGKEVWVDFGYENLATFCFYCGTVGHVEKNCINRLTEAKRGTIVEGQYGEWLRANPSRGEVSKLRFEC